MKFLKVAALALGPLGGCSHEGIKMDRLADGVIDDSERVAMVHEVYSWNKATQDTEVLYLLLNDLRVSRKKWLAKKAFV